MDITERLELLEVREMVYSFLGSVFLIQPNREQIDTLLDQQLFEEFPLELISEGFRQGLDLLQEWARTGRQEDREKIVNELKQDYAALFIGPGHLPAPPWESVYLTEEKLTFGEPTLEVRDFYRRHGLEFERKNIEPDDHFGLEMEFMAKLVAMERQALEDGDHERAEYFAREQAAFLQQHLLRWSDQFTQDVVEHAETPYYRGLALMAQDYLLWDNENLAGDTI